MVESEVSVLKLEPKYDNGRLQLAIPLPFCSVAPIVCLHFSPKIRIPDINPNN